MWPQQHAGRFSRVGWLAPRVLAAAAEHEPDGRADSAREEEPGSEGGRGEHRHVDARSRRVAQRVDRVRQPLALELDLATDRFGV